MSGGTVKRLPTLAPLVLGVILSATRRASVSGSDGCRNSVIKQRSLSSSLSPERQRLKIGAGFKVRVTVLYFLPVIAKASTHSNSFRLARAPEEDGFLLHRQVRSCFVSLNMPKGEEEHTRFERRTGSVYSRSNIFKPQDTGTFSTGFDRERMRTSS